MFPIVQEESHGLSHLLPVSTMTHTFQVHLDGSSGDICLGPLPKDLDGAKAQVTLWKEEQEAEPEPQGDWAKVTTHFLAYSEKPVHPPSLVV